MAKENIESDKHKKNIENIEKNEADGTKTEENDREKKIINEKTKDSRPKRTEAVVNGRNLPISTKQAVAICRYIKNKNIDKAILMLEEAEKFKRAIPMKGEIPHRKGKIMSGRYPVKAVREFIKLLKSLKANALANELELEKCLVLGKADVAPRPYRRFGRTRFKRTHVTLKLIQSGKKEKKALDKEKQGGIENEKGKK